MVACEYCGNKTFFAEDDDAIRCAGCNKIPQGETMVKVIKEWDEDVAYCDNPSCLKQDCNGDCEK